MFNIPIEERVARLEESFRQGRNEHQDIAEALKEITEQVAKPEVYLANANGGFTISVKGKRVKFAGEPQSALANGHPGRWWRRRLGNRLNIWSMVER